MDTTSLCKHPLLLQSGAKLNSVTQLGVDKKTLYNYIYCVCIGSCEFLSQDGWSKFLPGDCVCAVGVGGYWSSASQHVSGYGSLRRTVLHAISVCVSNCYSHVLFCFFLVNNRSIDLLLYFTVS